MADFELEQIEARWTAVEAARGGTDDYKDFSRAAIASANDVPSLVREVKRLQELLTENPPKTMTFVVHASDPGWYYVKVELSRGADTKRMWVTREWREN